jgi:outer membrane murein-binding lipoprotein Lpp
MADTTTPQPRKLDAILHDIKELMANNGMQVPAGFSKEKADKYPAYTQFLALINDGAAESLYAISDRAQEWKASFDLQDVTPSFSQQLNAHIDELSARMHMLRSHNESLVMEASRASLPHPEQPDARAERIRSSGESRMKEFTDPTMQRRPRGFRADAPLQR